jgi:hypothetical protein
MWNMYGERCLQRENLLKSGAGVSWGAHPSCLILLYRGLFGLVLKYGSVRFTNMARTHMLGLKRVQYRSLRIALGLMGSNPNNCVGVFGGIAPLAEKFAYMNFRYLVAAFYRLGHSLKDRLGVLGALNMGRCIRGYSDFLLFDIVLASPSRGMSYLHSSKSHWWMDIWNRNLLMFRRPCIHWWHPKNY